MAHDFFTPERLATPFLIDPSAKVTYSYRDVLVRIASLAAKSEAAHGPATFPVVAVLENSVAFVVTALFCLYRGHPFLPLHPATSSKEIRSLVSQLGARWVVTDVSHADELGATVLGIAEVCEVSPDAPEPGALLHPSTASTIALYIPTSGTTGTPKLICHRRDSLFTIGARLARVHRVTPSSRFSSEMPMSFSGGFMQLMMVASAGASVVVTPAFHAPKIMSFWDRMAEHEVNSLWLVPTIVVLLLKLRRGPRGSDYCARNVRLVLCGSSPLDPTTKRSFAETFHPITENYGLSETLMLTGATEPSNDQDVGASLEGVDLEIHDSEGNPLPVGVPGEVMARTDCLMRGYANPSSPEPALELRRGLFATGDIGYLDETGKLHISGREKDLVIRAGLNVHPAEVESVLASHPRVVRAVVVGVPHPVLGEDVVAVIMTAADDELEAFKSELVVRCADNLVSYKVPSAFIQVRSLPLTISGKVRKAVIRDALVRASASQPLASTTTIDLVE